MRSHGSLILAAGMPRSGSTWLYNAARLLIANSPSLARDFSCGWIGDWNNIPKKKLILIKVHDFDRNLLDHSKFVLYSYRDIRDVIASNQRKFGHIPSIEAVDELILLHQQWMDVADFVMRYESMLQNQDNLITEIMHNLSLDSIDPAQIQTMIEELDYDSEGPKNAVYHETNLYHRGHITDGRHGSWKGSIDIDLIRQIEDKYKWWFDKYRYSVDR